MSDTHQAEAPTEEAEGDSPETVTLAREMGWKPEAEWRGDPPKGGFTSATEYVRKGEKILPIVNARARKAEERASKLEQELETMRSEHRDTVRRIERMSNVALEQQRLQIVANYGARKEAAVEVGDKDAYRQADKDEREAIKAIDDKLKDEPAEKTPERRELPKQVKDVVDAWVLDNPWFNSDEEMNALANARHMKLLKDKPGLGLRENLDEVREYIKSKFPEKFGDAKKDDEEEDPPKRRGSPVEGGSRVNGSGGSGQWSKAPAEARGLAEKAGHLEYFLKPGETLEKNAAQAKERWAAKYFEGEQ